MSRTKSPGPRSNQRKKNIRRGLIVLIFVLDVLTDYRAQTFAQSPSPSPVQSVTPVIKVPDSDAPDKVDVVRVDIDLVNTPVSVTDRQGRYVPGLRPEDFRVYENGVEQRIALPQWKSLSPSRCCLIPALQHKFVSQISNQRRLPLLINYAPTTGS